MKEEEHGEEEELTEVVERRRCSTKLTLKKRISPSPSGTLSGKKRSGGIEKEVGASWAMAPA
jgi:hypothetical protein